MQYRRKIVLKALLLRIVVVGLSVVFLPMTGSAIDLPWEKDAATVPADSQPAGVSGTKDLMLDVPLQQKPARAEEIILVSPPPLPFSSDITEKEYIRRGLDAEDSKERVAFFSKALELNPDSYDAYYYRAVMHHAGERYDLAVADFSQALRIKPESSIVLNNRGVAYHQMKKYDFAISDFSKAIELNPAFGEAYNNRGVSLRSKGDIAGARKDYERAVLLDPTDEMAQMNLERLKRKGR